MWSASQRGRIARQAFRPARSEAGGFERVHSLCAFSTLKPQSWHVPRSRFRICCRTYQGLLRIFHSCTHGSPQNVRRGALTGPRHHRHIGSPSALRSGLPT